MTDKERLERLEKIKSEQESFMELYERKNRKQQDLIARDFMHQHSGYLIERVQELEYQNKTLDSNIDTVLKNNHKYRLENLRLCKALKESNNG